MALNKLGIFCLFLSAYFLSYFFRSTNAVIADDLVRDLALSAEQLGAMTGLFFAVFALMQFPIGFALDRLGARLTTGGLLLIAVLGSFVFASAQNYPSIALGRALIGLGVAGALMGSLKIFSRWFSAKQFASISGIFVAFGALGAVLATTPLEFLSNAVGWRSVFVAGGIATLMSSLLILVFARNQPKGETQEATQQNQGHLRELFAKPAFWQIALLNFAMAGSYFAYQGLWMGPYLTDALGLKDTTASQVLFLLSSASIVGYLLSGQVVKYLGVIKTLSLSTTIFFLSQLILAFLTQQSSSVLVAFLIILFGFFGAFNITIFSHLRILFPQYLIGRAFAFTNFFGFAGIAVMQWFLGVVVGRFPLNELGDYAGEGFRLIFLITSLLGLLSVVLYLPFLKQKR